MADEVDQTADRIENEVSFTVGELCRKAAAIPAGRPGECDFCGEDMPRLVGGACAPCRDKFKLL